MSSISSVKQDFVPLGVLSPDTVVTEARLTAVINQVVIPAIDAIPELVRQQLQPYFDRIDKKFEEIDKRFEQIDRRFDRLEKRMDGLEKRMDGLEKRMDGLEKRMDGLEKRMDRLERRVDRLEIHLDKQIRMISLNNRIRITTVQKGLNKRMLLIEKKQQKNDAISYDEPRKKSSVYASGVADAEFDVIVGKNEESI